MELTPIEPITTAVAQVVESKPSFTLGPWRHEPSADCPPLGTYDIKAPCDFGGEWIVAIAVSGIHGDPTEANARLIAAAPSLLAAIETVLHEANLQEPLATYLLSVVAEARGE